MRYAWILVDGFSLMYRESKSLPALEAGKSFEARRRLAARLDRIAGALADRLTLVYDGRGEGGPADEMGDLSIEVVFSPGDQTADTVIERMALAAPDPSRVLVVTSDRRERETVIAAGIATMGCRDFLREMDRLDRAAATPSSKPWQRTMGDAWNGRSPRK
ncbi:MAG: NYN domain-containing protein [Kiritimatiellae bacterium]|nr:NYN domain-containing protein [Kiritimatiellia bacterium]